MGSIGEISVINTAMIGYCHPPPAPLRLTLLDLYKILHNPVSVKIALNSIGRRGQNVPICVINTTIAQTQPTIISLERSILKRE